MWVVLVRIEPGLFSVSTLFFHKKAAFCFGDTTWKVRSSFWAGLKRVKFNVDMRIAMHTVCSNIKGLTVNVKFYCDRTRGKIYLLLEPTELEVKIIQLNACQVDFEPELIASDSASCLAGPQSQLLTIYLSAGASYRSIGRPPPPCPPYPPDPAARAAQGLPPLFVPAPFPSTAGPSTSAVPGTSIFRPGNSVGVAAAGTSPVGAGSKTKSFTSIAAPEYAHWNHEVYARSLQFLSLPLPFCSPVLSKLHLPGTSLPRLPTRHAPPAPDAPVFALAPVSAAPAPAFPGASALPVPDAGETFMTITTRPEFAGRSVERGPLLPIPTRAARKSTPRAAYNGVHVRRPRPRETIRCPQPQPSPRSPYPCSVQSKPKHNLPRKKFSVGLAQDREPNRSSGEDTDSWERDGKGLEGKAVAFTRRLCLSPLVTHSSFFPSVRGAARGGAAGAVVAVGCGLPVTQWFSYAYLDT
ncbi:hypothetical protein K438DRAFT_1791127 [Mycena galopus ATCC 62051]|nr:hypothetical protein K438DRAFT_1791127 [Mycena galopus ATCC 62051]